MNEQETRQDYQSRPRVRFPGMATDDKVELDEAVRRGGIGGVLLGEMCHGHVLTEVYADFDGEGHLVALHSHDIGSC